MSIDLMLKNCKTELELRAFAEAQSKTLQQTMKKNKELQEEIERLKKTSTTLPIVQKDGSPIAIESDEIEIAKIELNKLKQRAMDPDPLMLEDAKKVEIYTKILASRHQEKQKNFERDVKELDADALLAVIDAPTQKVE